MRADEAPRARGGRVYCSRNSYPVPGKLGSPKSPLSVSVLSAMVATCSVGLSETDSDVKFSASPRKSAIFPGEPCVLDVVLVNDGTSDLEIHLGYDGIGAFWFEIFDAAGKRICSSSPMVMEGGISRPSRALVRAGEKEHRLLVLNQWCSTLLSPGKYDVICYLRTSNLAARAGCRIVVDEENAEEHTKLFSDLAATITGRKPFGEQCFASRMLSSSRSPRAVVALAQVVRRSRAPQFRKDALMALGRIRTLEAVQVLCSIALKEGEKSANVRRTATALVHEIFETVNDPVVREACEPVTSTTVSEGIPAQRD